MEEKNLIFVDILKATDRKSMARIGSVSITQWYGSADPDQNVTDSQH